VRRRRLQRRDVPDAASAERRDLLDRRVAPELAEQGRTAERDRAAENSDDGELEQAKRQDAGAIHGSVIAGVCVLPAGRD
jgi:hypothetical protein